MNPSSQPSAPSRWTIALAFVTLYISWGTTYLAIKFGVQDAAMPPALFSGSRVTLAGVFLLGLLYWCGEKVRLSGRDLIRIAITGVLFFVGGNGLLTMAQTRLDSGVAAILVATTPLWMALLELLHPGGDRLDWHGWLGLLLGLFGVVFMLAPDTDMGTLLGWNASPYLVFGSCISWSIGSLFWRYKHAECSHFVSAAYKMILGGGALALLGVSLGEVGRLPERVTPGAVFCFVYLLVVGSLLGYLSFNFLLHHVSAAQVGTYAYVNPIVAVFLGWLWGEPMTLWIGGGILFILLGVALVRQGSKSAKAATGPASVIAALEPEPPPQPAAPATNLSP